jgi:hypothetical protein
MFQVVEIYSEYINNFSRAMELVRLETSHEADPLCFQVVEIYSEYINNFSRAMELVRLEAKRRILMRLTL